MAKVLLLDTDEQHLKLMLEALKLTGSEDASASYQAEDVHVFVKPEPLKPEEIPKGKQPEPYDHIIKALNTTPFDFIMMDAAEIKGSPLKWVEEFRKKITLEQNKQVRIVLTSYTDDIDLVRKLVISGTFLDYILKPIDGPLFREKFSLLASKNGTYKKELYSIGTEQPVNVAYNFVIEDISEFGLTLKSNRPYISGEFVTFYSPVFKTDKKAEIIGRCYKSEKVQNSTDHKSQFVFVGAGDAIRKQIRSWMKQEYVKKKQAA